MRRDADPRRGSQEALSGSAANNATELGETKTLSKKFRTTHWATRALAEYVMDPQGMCLEPACRRGYMPAASPE